MRILRVGLSPPVLAFQLAAQTFPAGSRGYCRFFRVAVPGAECILANQATGAVLTVRSAGDGSCIFASVLPGT
jgi:hypothetical protein